MPEIDIEPAEIRLDVEARAVPLIRQLLNDSKHPNPILAILWTGSGATSDNLIWGWEVTTVNDRWRDLIDYIRFCSTGFTFHSTHADIAFLISELNNLVIRETKGKLAVSRKEDN
jgi:hypothetical protein